MGAREGTGLKLRHGKARGEHTSNKYKARGEHTSPLAQARREHTGVYH